MNRVMSIMFAWLYFLFCSFLSFSDPIHVFNLRGIHTFGGDHNFLCFTSSSNKDNKTFAENSG